MDIDAFREFLDVCFIKTGQMNMMNALAVKSDEEILSYTN